MLPQLATGGCTPRPMKSSAASVRMICPHPEARGHDHHRQDIRNDVPEDDPPVACADAAGGSDEFPTRDRECLAANEPRDATPDRRGDDDRQGERVVLDGEPDLPGRPYAKRQQARDEDQEKDRRDREQHVDEAHQPLVDPSPEESGRQADGSPDEDGERHGEEAHAERNSRPPHEACEGIAPELIRAEPVLG